MNEILKNCCACGNDKPLKSFYKNVALKDGITSRCKGCINGRVKCRKKSDSVKAEPIRKKEFPYITNPTKVDWIETYLFLQDIGYELRDDLSIHEQFCLKYGFKPKKKVYEARSRFTPKELGLI